MSRSTISTFKIFELFPDAETARRYLESRLWPNGAIPEHVYAAADDEIAEADADEGHIVVGGEHYDWRKKRSR